MFCGPDLIHNCSCGCGGGCLTGLLLLAALSADIDGVAAQEEGSCARHLLQQLGALAVGLHHKVMSGSRSVQLRAIATRMRALVWKYVTARLYWSLSGSRKLGWVAEPAAVSSSGWLAPA